MNLNELAKKVHQSNIKWWQNPETGEPIERNYKELLALVVSEVYECLDGERKDLWDDKIVTRKMAEVEMADAFIRLLDFAGGFNVELKLTIANNLEEIINSLSGSFTIPENKPEALLELTGHIIKITPEYSHWVNASLAYIILYCRKHNYDLLGAMEEKLIYNATRKDHTHEARLAEGGKKF